MVKHAPIRSLLVDDQGDPITASNPLQVAASVSATAQTVAKATAAAPTYVEGDTAAPLSVDLAGGLRITGTISASSSTKSTAADPSYSEGVTTNPLSSDLTGYLRSLCKQTGTWTVGLSAGTNLVGKVAIDATNPGVSNVVYISNLPAAVAVNSGVVGASVLRTVEASDGPVPTVLGSKTDAKSTATDTTSVSSMSVWKQISASVQAIATAIAGTLTIAAHALVTGSSGGWTAGHLICANTTNATSIKASAGTLGFLSFQNKDTAPVYVKFYNKASAPTVGSDTPVLTFMVPGNTNGTGNNPQLFVGLDFSTGIAMAVTAGIADNDSTAVPATSVCVNYGYK